MSPGRSHVSHVSPARDAGSRSHSRGSKPALVIPRAKVTPSRGHTNNGYNSDTDDRFSQETQVRKKRISKNNSKTIYCSEEQSSV